MITNAFRKSVANFCEQAAGSLLAVIYAVAVFAPIKPSPGLTAFGCGVVLFLEGSAILLRWLLERG